jgi:hypothetical protein
MGSIPWSSIVQWSQFNGITDPNTIDKTIRYIRAMERAEADHRAQKDAKRT